MPSRICCTVIAGVHFFSPPGFGDQEPGGEQRERLMMVPAFPIANLVVGQAGFALGALDAFLDAMFGLGNAGELGQFHVRRGIRQIVVGFDHASVFAVAVTNHDQHFFMAFLPSVVAPHDASLDDLDHERTFGAVAHIDLRPGFLRSATRPNGRRAARVASVVGRDRNSGGSSTSRSRINVFDGTANR